jgi:hypothetical protein
MRTLSVASADLKANDVLFLCNSQYLNIETALAESFEKSVKEAGANVLLAHQYHKGFNHYVQYEGYWHLLPWIYDLLINNAESPPIYKTWYFFAEPRTRVNVPKLLATLGAYDASKYWFVGKALKDTVGSITRHYHTEMAYPLLPTGFAISGTLMEALVESFKTEPPVKGFNIDPAFALAQTLSGRLKVAMTDDDAFCSVSVTAEPVDGCATSVLAIEEVFARARTTLGTVPVLPSEVVVGVKTHVKLHDRIPVIESTWGGDFKAAGVEVLYLSDSEDAALGTVDLGKEFGEVYNEKWAVCGHCAKCMAALKHLSKYYADESKGGKKFLLLVDDDTTLRCTLNSSCKLVYEHSLSLHF